MFESNFREISIPNHTVCAGDWVLRDIYRIHRTPKGVLRTELR